MEVRFKLALERLAPPFFGVSAIALLIYGSLPPLSYSRDPQVEYLSARALRDGLDIFTPTLELARRYLPVATTNFDHPNPHPPALALLFVPASYLPLPALVLAILALNVVAMLAIGRALRLPLGKSLMLLAWPPVFWLASIGQYELFVVLLAILAWRAAEAGNDWRAGLWLGAAAALKLYPAALVLPFLFKRRWKIPLATAAIMLLEQITNLAIVGPAGLVRYYREIVPAVASYYIEMALNGSPYGALLRLFGESVDVEPLFSAPSIVMPVAAVLAVIGLVLLATMPLEIGAAALLLVLPNGWGYYFVLALPLLVNLTRRREWRCIALAGWVAIGVCLPIISFVSDLTQWTTARAPAWIGLAGALQSLGVLLVVAFAASLVVSGHYRPIVWHEPNSSPQVPTTESAMAPFSLTPKPNGAKVR